MTIVMNDYTFPWIPLISKSPEGWAVHQSTFHAFTHSGSLLVAVSSKLDSSFCLVFVCNLPFVATSETIFFILVNFPLFAIFVLFALLFILPLLPPVYYFNPLKCFSASSRIF